MNAVSTFTVARVRQMLGEIDAALRAAPPLEREVVYVRMTEPFYEVELDGEAKAAARAGCRDLVARWDLHWPCE